MPPPIKYINEEPNIENTILYHAYQASSPAKFSADDDKYIIYEGGSFRLEVKNRPLEFIPKFTSDQVNIYVLSSCFIIWSTKDSLGLEIPYQLIYLHALDKNSLYLQIQILPDDVFEVILHPTVEPKNELLKEVTGNAESVYQAMSKCSAMHYDSDNEENHVQEEDELPSLEIPSQWIEERHYKNEGNADDLDELDDTNQSDEIIAGMSVDVGYAQIAGNKRNEHDYASINSKKNKLF
ncbi:LOT5 [Candida pseudojiufengensis]|uniref:LOT5 n=1 Tax=Candida pseudojiufengensis TaxID=497109 RepID=UPI00222500BB|nr:LOT5 [Candida pseudojiufengensis]KAI5961245.1 LOT5 [Candida pseudojiufengensis]